MLKNKAILTHLHSVNIFGIKHETTAPYTPEQNGLSERAISTMFNQERAAMNAANMMKQSSTSYGQNDFQQ